MGSHIIPGLRYDECPAAITFLCEAFGFERHLVVEGDKGAIAHAQLTRGDTMIMVGSVRGDDDPFAAYLATPAETGGRCTMAVILVIDDVDAHHAQAVAAGAEILLPPTDQPYGGRLYSALDPEGNLWHFGSYDPWA